MLRGKRNIEKEIFSIKSKLEEIIKSLDLNKPEHIIRYGKIKRYLVQIKEIIMLDNMLLATAQEIQNEISYADAFYYDINEEFIKLIKIQNIHKPDKWLLYLKPLETI